MKISLNKKEIVNALSKIQSITDRKTSLSITSDVLIKAYNSKITITANNLETVFYGTYEAKVIEDGVFSINSKKLYEILKEYPDDKIIINEMENRLVEIGRGDSIYNIVSSDYKNFPETPVVEDIEFIEIKSNDLKKMIDVSSIVGYSGNEIRIYVLGALIEKIIKDDCEILRIVSTDSRRLNCYEAEFTGTLNIPNEGIIVPKKGLLELNKFLDYKKDSFNIGIKDNYFIFKDENESIMITLLQGEYPNYKQLINNINTMIPIEFDMIILTKLMKRISILTTDRHKAAIFNFKNNELIVKITNPEIGEANERIVIPFSANEIKSAFNPQYFIDALGLFENKTVLLNIKEKNLPCIFKSLDNDKLICAIMAMNLSEETI